ncbi:hypothetical protein EVAR_63704_1 [Eumeta japonica]|uniref:Uncharacterized protein n=1 Tax=Eumeta variegata TaxID=151549 RepID=A0A4C1ZZC6_EUMVA|nr:hypothetical protein EVAR_63704_1 [Eumeta japonica]
MAGTRAPSGELPRATAYYYGDLERLKRVKSGGREGGPGAGPGGARDGDADDPKVVNDIQASPDELSEYVESNEVFYNDGAVREVPPLRDRRVRQWSLPEDPAGVRPVEETYSTAGTFPMPEPKEKEPLLAELEIVGRLPLAQLDSGSGVRRSRSWYLCCPNVGEEELSRESSWRYSSLRPVTAPPMPNPHAFMVSGATVVVVGNGGGGAVAGRPPALQSFSFNVSLKNNERFKLMNNLNILHLLPRAARARCHQYARRPQMPDAGRPEDAVALRAERDALARALCSERARAAAAARAQDARLAELHGVIAELVRRRAEDKRAAAIPEDEEDTDRDGTARVAGAPRAVRAARAHTRRFVSADECESSTQPAGGAADADRTDQVRAVSFSCFYCNTTSSVRLYFKEYSLMSFPSPHPLTATATAIDTLVACTSRNALDGAGGSAALRAAAALFDSAAAGHTDNTN